MPAEQGELKNVRIRKQAREWLRDVADECGVMQRDALVEAVSLWEAVRKRGQDPAEILRSADDARWARRTFAEDVLRKELEGPEGVGRALLEISTASVEDVEPDATLPYTAQVPWSNKPEEGSEWTVIEVPLEVYRALDGSHSSLSKSLENAVRIWCYVRIDVMAYKSLESLREIRGIIEATTSLEDDESR